MQYACVHITIPVNGRVAVAPIRAVVAATDAMVPEAASRSLVPPRKLMCGSAKLTKHANPDNVIPVDFWFSVNMHQVPFCNAAALYPACACVAGRAANPPVHPVPPVRPVQPRHSREPQPRVLPELLASRVRRERARATALQRPSLSVGRTPLRAPLALAHDALQAHAALGGGGRPPAAARCPALSPGGTRRRGPLVSGVRSSRGRL